MQPKELVHCCCAIGLGASRVPRSLVSLLLLNRDFAGPTPQDKAEKPNGQSPRLRAIHLRRDQIGMIITRVVDCGSDRVRLHQRSGIGR